MIVLSFLPPEIGGDAIAATMSKLADADVLVIDLRGNGGRGGSILKVISEECGRPDERDAAIDVGRVVL